MDKICFKLVLNRENNLKENMYGMVEVEARLLSEKIYLPTNVYIKQEYWNPYNQEIASSHPNHELLNRYLQERILKLEWKELQMWKNDTPLTLEQLMVSNDDNKTINVPSFWDFCRDYICNSRKRESTKKNLLTTVKILYLFNPNTSFSNITYLKFRK